MRCFIVNGVVNNNKQMKNIDREFMLRHSIRKINETISNNVANNHRPSRYRTLRLLVNKRSFLMGELVKIEECKLFNSIL